MSFPESPDTLLGFPNSRCTRLGFTTTSTTLSSPVTFQHHDFFTAQPTPSPADAFLLRYILHNWSDADAERIIRALKPALREGVRLLVMEYMGPQVLESSTLTTDVEEVGVGNATYIGSGNGNGNMVSQKSASGSSGSTSNTSEKAYRHRDIQMLALLHAKERTLEEYINLMQRAEPRFRFVASRPTGGDMAVMEWVYH
ncbi:S-adenosyl-L-methionine-dependent methyltransferase [Aspergillus heterothallicus]